MKITHDLHVHTTISGCANETATVENYLAYAKDKGIKKIGFADHFWDEGIPGEPSCYVPENFTALMTLKLFDMTAERGIAVEFNTAQTDWFDMTDEEIAATQKIRMLKLALKAGCKFTIGSDSHGTNGFERVELADRVTDIIGIKESDLAEIAM